MQIQIKNLGAIKNADIDLKPISVFIGENSTGKTWAAYTIAYILSQHSYFNYTNLFNSGVLKDTYPLIDKSINEVLQTGNTKLDLIKLCDLISEQYINNVAKNCNNALKGYFATGYASFEDLELKITISEKEFLDLKNGLTKRSFIRSLSPDSEGKAKLQFFKDKDDRFLYIISETNQKGNLLPKKVIENFIYDNVFFLLHYNFSRKSFIFPSERTGFSTISLIDYKKTSEGTSRQYQKGDDEPRLRHNISIPIGNILDIINDYLSLENHEELFTRRLNNPQTTKFVQCGELFQNLILHGTLAKSKPTADNRTEILYKYDNNIELDMYMVSSIVKASSPLVIYLKYFAEKGHLIVIDEPEMNLHPKAQAQFAEFLGLLASSGLKIIITTHSTFFVDHFVNLIKASKKRNKKDIANLFFLKNPSAFIPQKNIGAYLFENNTVRNILSDKGLIDWDTFSVISEQLSDIYFKMDDKNAL